MTSSAYDMYRYSVLGTPYRNTMYYTTHLLLERLAPHITTVSKHARHVLLLETKLLHSMQKRIVDEVPSRWPVCRVPLQHASNKP